MHVPNKPMAVVNAIDAGCSMGSMYVPVLIMCIFVDVYEYEVCLAYR